MKALVKTAKGKGLVEIRDVDPPRPGPDDVLVRIRAVSVCGSDVHIYHDQHPYWPPVIMGHEFAGEIVELGENVTGWQVGDPVVSETRTGSCGVCRYCQSGVPQVCPDKRPFGIGIDGACAELLSVPARLLHRIPDGVSLHEASMCEPTAVCYHALIERVGVNAGDTAVVCGPGPIGLISLLLLKIAGARVVVTGTARSAALKLVKADEIGADRTLVVGQDDVEQAVLDMTGGYGADLVAECSGSGPAIDLAPRIARRQGTMCALGIHGQPTVAFPWDVAVFKALRVTFAFSSSWSSWESVLRLMGTGQLRLEPLITHTFPLDQWQQAYETIEAGKAIKVILEP